MTARAFLSRLRIAARILLHGPARASAYRIDVEIDSDGAEEKLRRLSALADEVRRKLDDVRDRMEGMDAGGMPS